MKLLNRKLLRDVRHNWTQFLSVFLMAFLSIVVFVGLQGSWRGLQISLNDYLQKDNLANYWVQGSQISNQDIKKIKSLTGVKNVQAGTRLQLNQGKHHLIVDTYQVPITKSHLIAGEKYNQNSYGIWINKEYAHQHNLKLGDPLKLSLNAKSVSLPIKGIIQSPNRIYFTGTQEFIAPNYNNYGYALITPRTLTSAFGYQDHNILEIKGTHQRMRHQIEKILQGRLVAYYMRTTLPEVSTATERVSEIRNLSYLFSFIFILLAILAMYTTIRRLIESQTSEIATFKALGFSNTTIGLHYASFGLLVGSLGTIAGALFSPLISWYVLRTQQQMFSIPHWKIAYTYSALIIIVLVITICVLASFLAARTAIKGLPAKFLRGKEESTARHILLERWLTLWKHCSYASRWAIRDAFINRIRTMMGIIGVAGGMMLMIAGVGMPQSMDHLVKKAYTQDYSYSKRVNLKSPQQLQQKSHYNEQWIQTTQAHFSPDDGYNRLLTVVSHGAYVNMKTIDRKTIQNGGLYVTHGFAKRAHITKGEKIKVRTLGSNKQFTFKVKGIVASETNQGAYITKHTWTSAGGFYHPTTLLIGKNVHLNRQAVSSSISVNEQESNAFRFVNNLMSIFILIIMFGALLIIIVLYNLGSLSFVERTRDYATLRVLGIHRQELRQLTLIENVITTFIGWLIGIPTGIWFLGQYVNTFSTINLEYTRYFDWKTILIASLFVWICSLGTTIFISRRIKKIDMVQSLKGVE